ncbi:MAG: pirin family protein [Leptolyngbyaceae cyanobacterium]
MSSAIQLVIEPHVQDLGGFEARRLLPSEQTKMVGPFIFFDHLGPANFPPGKGIDVRPHPHINLATVTYLFDGVLLHRDSLGTIQEIRPGAVNWMIAGKGISHSERSPDTDRAVASTLHGIQTWVALPDDAEETEPSFSHYVAADIPTWQVQGVTVKLIAGQAYGCVSPVKTFSSILYLDLHFPPNSQFLLETDHRDRAVYTVTPGITVAGQVIPQHRLVILPYGQAIAIGATEPGRCIVIGGAPLGTRYKWWNFVSSRLDRIEQAKKDWQAGRFGQVPEETEFIPLPES